MVRRMIDARAVASLLGLSQRAVYDLHASGALPALSAENAPRVDRSPPLVDNVRYARSSEGASPA